MSARAKAGGKTLVQCCLGMSSSWPGNSKGLPQQTEAGTGSDGGHRGAVKKSYKGCKGYSEKCSVRH